MKACQAHGAYLHSALTMLVIRLQRTGRENLATYRVVVAHKARPVKGKFLEIVGHYLPQRGIESFVVKQERIEHWVKTGAVPSDTVARLLKRTGAKNMEKFISRYAKRRSKKAGDEPVEAPAAPAASAPVAEAPSAEPAAGDSTPPAA